MWIVPAQELNSAQMNENRCFGQMDHSTTFEETNLHLMTTKKPGVVRSENFMVTSQLPAGRSTVCWKAYDVHALNPEDILQGVSSTNYVRVVSDQRL